MKPNKELDKAVKKLLEVWKKLDNDPDNICCIAVSGDGYYSYHDLKETVCFTHCEVINESN